MTLFLIHRTSSKQKIIEQLEFKSSSITNKTLFAGSSKKEIIFFNLLFDYTYKNKLFKNKIYLYIYDYSYMFSMRVYYK